VSPGDGSVDLVTRGRTGVAWRTSRGRRSVRRWFPGSEQPTSRPIDKGKPGASRGRKATGPHSGSPGHRNESNLQNPRDRIVTAAYPLFAERGVRDVTEAEIQEAAGVTAQELAAVFPSRTAVAAACLLQHERDLTMAVVEAGARARGATPEARLLAVFDVMEEWIQSEEQATTTFLDILLRLASDRGVSRPNTDQHAHSVPTMIASLAIEAGLREPEHFARSFHVLMKGSILSALEGDTLTGVQARELGRELIARHRPAARDIAAEAALTGGTWFGDSSFDLEAAPGADFRRDPAYSLLDWDEISDLD
jgi:AcrR family transcriptional regulator